MPRPAKHLLHSLILFILGTIATAQSLTSEMTSIASAHDMMGGAAVVFCESGILDSVYIGKADLGRDIDVDQNTKFRIASISKTITAIAVMKLVEDGDLDLDDDIGNILGYAVRNPFYPTTAITVRMLLSHKSSIIDGSTYSSFLSATVSNNPIPDLSTILTSGGTFYTTDQFNTTQPGTYFNYSNINYVTLGTIVEKVSGMRFDIFCNEFIFEPLGLDASFNVNHLDDIDEVAVLYRKPSGVWTPQIDNYLGIQPSFTNLTGYVPGTNGGRFGPQGGLRCSAQALAEIFICLFNPTSCDNALLSSQTVEQMTTDNWTYNGSNGNNYYGLFRSWGLGVHRITSTPNNDVALPGSSLMFGHAGEAYGLVSDVYYDPTRKVGMVFLTNGVGNGYQFGSSSAFYSVEEEVFEAIEDHANLESCQIVGIEEDPIDKLRTYPNPVPNTLIVESDNGSLPRAIEVLDLSGAVIINTLITEPTQAIDVSLLDSGVYIIKSDNSATRMLKL